jgi:hypothetical protein
MEALSRKSGREFKDLPREEMESLWDAVKKADVEPTLMELSGAQARK